MNPLKSALAAFALAAALTPCAQAGLVDVKFVEIKHRNNTDGDGWLQVAEFAAFNMGGTNVALASNGGVATAPDTWDGSSTPGKAIDGNTSNLAFPSMFHEGSPLTYDTLTITFASVQELASFQIWGRSDCCSSRDIYDITFKNSSGAVLYFVDDLSAANAQHTAAMTLPNTATNVPEPGTLALLGVALAGVLRTRRR